MRLNGNLWQKENVMHAVRAAPIKLYFISVPHNDS